VRRTKSPAEELSLPRTRSEADWPPPVESWVDSTGFPNQSDEPRPWRPLGSYTVSERPWCPGLRGTLAGHRGPTTTVLFTSNGPGGRGRLHSTQACRPVPLTAHALSAFPGLGAESARKREGSGARPSTVPGVTVGVPALYPKSVKEHPTPTKIGPMRTAESLVSCSGFRRWPCPQNPVVIP
jgi:hypothetical protein